MNVKKNMKIVNYCGNDMKIVKYRDALLNTETFMNIGYILLDAIKHHKLMARNTTDQRIENALVNIDQANGEQGKNSSGIPCKYPCRSTGQGNTAINMKMRNPRVTF